MLSEREGKYGSPPKETEVLLPKKEKWMLDMKEQTDVQYIPIVVMATLKISGLLLVYILKGQIVFLNEHFRNFGTHLNITYQHNFQSMVY